MASLITLNLGPSTYAQAADCDYQFMNNQDFGEWQDRCDSVCGGSAQQISGESIGLEKSPVLEEIFRELIGRGFSAGQAAAIMGNIYAESGFNSDAHEIGNDIGYGLAQWSFGRRTQLEQFAASKGVPPSSIPMQIEFLTNEYNQVYKSRLEKTAFADASDIGAATRAWMDVFEVPYIDPASSDPAKINSKRIPAALKVYEYYKDLSPGQSGVAAESCQDSNGIIAGNLVKTALGLALTSPAANGTTALSQARDTYQKALPQFNPIVDVTDCGGFIAVSMIASGVDPNYPKVLVSTQENYVRNNPDKYQVLDGLTSTGDLQPGDILYTDGHTTMFTGEATYPSVDASLYERVPSVRDAGSAQWMLSSGATVARIIK